LTGVSRGQREILLKKRERTNVEEDPAVSSTFNYQKPTENTILHGKH
jgi:hypothetical protein